jgi:hypothetical protein
MHVKQFMNKLMQKLPDELNKKFSQILLARKLSKPDQYFCTRDQRDQFLILHLPLF